MNSPISLRENDLLTMRLKQFLHFKILIYEQWLANARSKDSSRKKYV